jgi:hypothetical protein
VKAQFYVLFLNFSIAGWVLFSFSLQPFYREEKFHNKVKKRMGQARTWSGYTGEKRKI